MAKKKEKTLEEKLQEALVAENQWPYMLPENWCWAKGEYILKKMESQKPDGDYFYYIDIDAIDNSCQIVTETKQIAVCDAPSRASRKLHVGDTIFSLVRPYLKNIAYIDKSLSNSIASTGFYVCTPKKNIFPKFFYWLMISPYVVDGLNKYMKGDNSPSIRGGDIEGFCYPIPPLPEQKRIVHRIESLFAKLDEAKEKIQQVLDGAEMRKAAILHKAFTGELTKNWRKENGISEDSWESVKLKELGEFNRGKSKHRPRNDPRLFNGPYPFIQTGDVSSSGMYIQKHSQTLSEFGMQQSRLFPKDTLCITIAANIGKVAILTYDCCFPDSVVGFTPNERTFSKYMYYSMLKIQKEIEALAPAVAQKNLSLKLLLDVNVQIPSVEEQHAIVKIIERLLKHEKNVISASMRSIESIETMKKSILAKAFRGELGTNNPTEDSALNLLKEVLQDKS